MVEHVKKVYIESKDIYINEKTVS